MLNSNELNENIVEIFADFVYELLVDDELQLARLLRKKLIFKLDAKRVKEQEKEAESLYKFTSVLTKKNFDCIDNSPGKISPYFLSQKYLSKQSNFNY